MAFTLRDVVRINTSLPTAISLMAAVVPSYYLGPIGEALLGRKKNPLPCNRKKTSRVLTPSTEKKQSPLLSTGREDQSSHINSSNWREGCHFGEIIASRWGQNAGGAHAKLFSLAVAERLWNRIGAPIVRYGTHSSNYFAEADPIVELAEEVRENFSLPISAQEAWVQTCLFAERLYSETQRVLRKEFPGEETITLYRGISGQAADDFVEAQRKGQNISTRIIESWTDSIESTEFFSERGGGSKLIMKAEIPISNVIAHHWVHDIVNHWENEWLIVTDGVLSPNEWEAFYYEPSEEKEKEEEKSFFSQLFDENPLFIEEDLWGGEVPEFDGEGRITLSEIERRRAVAREKQHLMQFPPFELPWD